MWWVVPLSSITTSRPAAIVTGGTGGIGLATAELLAQKRMNLILAYGHDTQRAQQAKHSLQDRYNVQVQTVQGDLTTDRGRDQTIQNMKQILESPQFGGRVAAIVHAAGFFHERLLEVHLAGSIPNFTMYDEYQSIYPKTLVALAELAIERMDDGVGRIVCVTNPGCNSMQAPRVGYDVPGQAKATMEWLVRMYALRLASRGICINAVSPGYTDTKEWDKARAAMGRGDMEAGRRLLDERMLSRSPMKRWAEASEIAQTIAYLAAEQSGLITGAFVPVDGGLHMA